MADGYQQLVARIHALEQDFEGTIAVLRTKVELVLQAQNLAQQDQNMKLLASVDQTTKSPSHPAAHGRRSFCHRNCLLSEWPGTLCL